MTLLTVDDGTDAGAWEAREAGGGPSSEIAVAPRPAPPGGLEISATTGARGHYVERDGPAHDLSAFEDLQLVLGGDRVGDGSEAAPFYLELRLGSAAAPVGSAQNPWARLLPVAGERSPAPQLVSLGDLPAAVRSALTAVRITCTDAGAPFVCGLEGIAALHERMLADVDAALLERLDGKVTIDGAAIPAALAEPGADVPAGTHIRIANFDVRAAEERSPVVGPRTDFRSNGYALRPPRTAYDLLYEVTAIAHERAGEAQLIEYVVAELGPRTTLLVNGSPLPIELVPLPAGVGVTRPDRVTLWFRVRTSQRRPAAAEPAVPPFQLVDLDVDNRARV